jgi:uncharacterized protein (DUF885 family)
LDPVEATAAGLSEHDHRFGDYGTDGLKQSLAALKSIGAALESVETVSLDDEIDRTALLNDLRVRVHRYERERVHERNPLFWVNHALEGLYLPLVFRDRAANHTCRSVTERLKAMPALLRSGSETLRACPAVLVETAIEVSRAGSAVISRVASELQPEVDGKVVDAACDAARDALIAFSAHLQSGLPESEDAEIGIGVDAFNFRLHYEHALQASAPDLLRLGTRMVADAERELARCAAQVAPGVAWPDLVDRLRDEQSIGEDLVSAYASEMKRSRDFVRSNGLVPVPQGELEVVETPDFLRPLIPFAAYQPPGAFSQDRTGWFYVTCPAPAAAESESNLNGHGMYELPCTALHEGYPGHHLQFLSAHAQPRIVRKVIASPLTVEGWALYCEGMMGEHGYYRDAGEALFRQLGLLWRAVRVVLDVQLHTRGMSFGDAVQLLTDKIHTDASNARSEVRRYCANPAYQLCCAVGARELAALRRDYEGAADGNYSETQFHTDVMSYGGLPVSLMRWGMGLSG